MPKSISIKSYTIIALIITFTILTGSLLTIGNSWAQERGGVENEPSDVLPPSSENNSNESMNDTQQTPSTEQDESESQSSPQNATPNIISCTPASNPCNGTDAEGTGEFHTVSSNGAIKLIKTHTNWRSTWTQIIPVQLDNILNTDLIFYSSSEHLGEFYTVSDNGEINLLKTQIN